MLVYAMAIWSILWPFGLHILWPFGLFYGHLVYFVAIWYILWLFKTFSPIWYAVPRQIWQPWSRQKKCFLRKNPPEEAFLQKMAIVTSMQI
jgi:hypothetical protein